MTHMSRQCSDQSRQKHSLARRMCLRHGSVSANQLLYSGIKFMSRTMCKYVFSFSSTYEWLQFGQNRRCPQQAHKLPLISEATSRGPNFTLPICRLIQVIVKQTLPEGSYLM